MFNTMWTAARFLLIGVIGMSLGLLAAPRSGQSTRRLLRDRGSDLLKNTGRYFSERRDELEEHSESLSNQALRQMRNLRSSLNR